MLIEDDFLLKIWDFLKKNKRDKKIKSGLKS
jgi:hypothetical protein